MSLEHVGLSFGFELPLAEIISANARIHWAKKAEKTKSLRNRAYLVAWEARLETPAFDLVRLEVRIGWPDKRRRDAANLSPTLKALIDGFVDAGLLPDDDDQHLIGPDLRPYVAGERGVVRLDFDFHEIQRIEETAQ